jgi:hypothetical protein
MTAVMILMAPVLAPSAGALAATGAAKPAAWAIVHGARLTPDNTLWGVAATSARSAWAVGREGYGVNGTRPGRPLLEHWNGRAWSKVSLRSSWPGGGGLGWVAASSATDAWALGTGPSGTSPRVLHLTRRGWRSSAFPGNSTASWANLGLAAAPGGRAWLIGIAAPGSGDSLIFGFDRGHWQPQSYDCGALSCSLDAISARSGKDAWVVGSYVTATGTGGPLALHWTGHRWQNVPLPYVRDGYLTGVFGVSVTNAWAVGAVFQTSTMLLYHWNGKSWRRMVVPKGLTVPYLGVNTSIAGDQAGHLWIYGFGRMNVDHASYLRFSGHRWSVVSGASIAGQSRVSANDVAPIPGTSAFWSVGGGFVAGLHLRAHIERYGLG